MKKIFLLLILAGTVRFAAAQFEGVLTYEASQTNKVVMTVSENKTNARIEAQIFPIKNGVPDATPSNTQNTILFDFQKARETHLNAKMNTAFITPYIISTEEKMMKLTDAAIGVQELAPEKIGNYACRHFVLTVNHGKKDLWITKDLGVSMICVAGEFLYYPPDGMALKKLVAAGGDGVVVKSLYGPITMLLTNVAKKSLPASVFAVPSGYTVTDRSAMMEELENQKKH